MKATGLTYQSVEGKTYSLFGDSGSTCGYYRLIKLLADNILIENDIEAVLETIRKYSPRKRFLRKIIMEQQSGSLISLCLNTIHEPLQQFTENVSGHLRNLSPVKWITDRRLATTEEQYHLYMLEIELTNRLNRQAFLRAGRKISLQPYCLQDFSVSCKASRKQFDYQCRACSKDCFQNHASRIMKEHDVEPYIWRGASIRKAAKDAYVNGLTFGISGIACIPELVAGMRKCNRHKIPVVGIPLNANRCIRWFGEFRPNSVDLDVLVSLLENT